MSEDTILYEDSDYKWIMFSFDDEEHEDRFLSLNQYLIISKGSALLIDPGSDEIFEELYAAVARHIDPKKIKLIFLSHQDPDVAGSITHWSVATQAKFVISKIWTRFMSHYGLVDMERLVALEDKGAKLSFGSSVLHFIPAHFLHSPGNFTLYDEKSKILFSGDIGAAVLPPWDVYKEVEDFDKHLPFLEGFHQRYMAGNLFCKKWVSAVRKYEIEQMAPQHGALFKKEELEMFLAWFDNLECGGDIL